MYFRQPQYFKNFYCIGDKCGDNCCYGWRINWTKEELDKLKNAPNCSDELKELIEKSFAPSQTTEGEYDIVFNSFGKCPCVTEEGLCRIQKELGAEYLSNTCMIYPRHYYLAGETMYRHCNMSCREAFRLMISDEKAMDLVNIPIKQKLSIKGVFMHDSDKIAARPELGYSGDLFEFFYEIIGDKKRDVETSIILGALAAQKLVQIIDNKEYDLIPEALKSFRQQFHNGAQLKAIENIKPNYRAKLAVPGEFLGHIESRNVMSSLVDSTGKLNIDLYLQGERRLDDTYKDRPYYLRNIALNLLLEFAMPFKFENKTLFENYSLFAASYAIFKLNAIAVSEFTQRKEESQSSVSAGNRIKINVNFKVNTDSYVCKSCAFVSRALCHSDNNALKLIEHLKKHNITTPAYLALLVK